MSEKIFRIDTLPQGFQGFCTTVAREDRPDFMIVISKTPAVWTGLFTKADFVGHHIVFCKKRSKNRIQALAVHAGIANALNGPAGYQDCEDISEAVARRVCIETSAVLLAFTGALRRQLPKEKIFAAIQKSEDDLFGETRMRLLARAISTTDRWPKYITRTCGEATISAIAKGAGMIEPNMGTMLAFIFTDAAVAQRDLRRMLKKSVDASFNCISVDGDMSPNDTVIALANGCAGNVELGAFQKILDEICLYLAKEIMKNGEGVHKVIEVTVCEARNSREAREVGKRIVNSKIFTSAIFGDFPHWGRIITAIGACGKNLKLENLKLVFGNTCVWNRGKPTDAPDAELAEQYLHGKDWLTLKVFLGKGKYTATVWGSDLSYEYIDANKSP